MVADIATAWNRGNKSRTWQAERSLSKLVAHSSPSSILKKGDISPREIYPLELMTSFGFQKSNHCVEVIMLAFILTQGAAVGEHSSRWHVLSYDTPLVIISACHLQITSSLSCQKAMLKIGKVAKSLCGNSKIKDSVFKISRIKNQSSRSCHIS